MPNIAKTAVQRIAGLEPFPQPPVIPVRLPLLLMHGFGIFAGLRRGGHLYDEAMNLRIHGVRAYSPNVAPYNTIEFRTEMWQNRIDRILDETRSDKLNVIAHSMGGLDARYLISVLGLHDRIATLTTVATPHHGTAAADFVLEQPGRIRAWLTEFANWVGAMAIEDGESDFRTALRQLTPEYVTETFNPAVPDHPAVRYHSYGGAAGKDTTVSINPFLRVLNGVIMEREGLNDGMVSVASARWGEYKGTIDADHTAQVGLYVLQNASFDANSFYRQIATELADCGF